MGKLNRIYRLTIQLQDAEGFNIDEALIIELPFGIDFTVDRSMYAGMNSLDIDIYNLSPNNRNKIFQDVYSNRNGQYRNIILEAGYQGQGMTVIFNGNVWTAYSRRSGVNMITHIHAVDGLSTQSGMINTTLQAGVTTLDVVNNLAQTMPDLKTGTINVKNHTFTRPVVLKGNSYRLLKTYTEDNVFVDMQEINVMRVDDVIEGFIPAINDNSGLLGAPERQDATLVVNMMFEPRLLIGQLLEITSRISPQFDGTYKLWGIKHSGQINLASAGNCTTTLQLQVGSQVFGRFNEIKAEQQQVYD